MSKACKTNEIVKKRELLNFSISRSMSDDFSGESIGTIQYPRRRRKINA
jgi:hypothetical protein